MPDRGRTPIEEIADRLRMTREAKGLQQATMARLVGISTQAWNNYETARKRISIDNALRVCVATGVSLDWIYRGDLRGVPVDLATRIQGALERSPKQRRRA